MIPSLIVPTGLSAGQTTPSSATPFTNPYLTISNAVTYSGLCRSTIYNLIRGNSPLVDSISVPGPTRPNAKRGKRLVLRESLDAYLTSLRTSASTPQHKASAGKGPATNLVASSVSQDASYEFQQHRQEFLECLTKASNDLSLDEFELFCEVVSVVAQRKRAPSSTESENIGSVPTRSPGRIVAAQIHDDCPLATSGASARPQASVPGRQRGLLSEKRGPI
jgi:hypothetical protein